jgi:hypothetical protein
MLARAAFWAALAVAFFILAFVAWREREKVKQKERPLPGLEHVFIMKPVADVLTNILRVESIGFVLAAIAAVYEVFA